MVFAAIAHSKRKHHLNAVARDTFCSNSCSEKDKNAGGMSEVSTKYAVISQIKCVKTWVCPCSFKTV